MNFNKKHLLLIALFVLLVSIPLSFATDSDDAQNTEIDTITSQTTSNIATATQTDIKTDNSNEINEKSRVETSTDKQQTDNKTLVKNDKNLKNDELKTTTFSSHYDYLMVDDNYEMLPFDIRVHDEDYIYIYQGKVSVQLDSTLIDKIDLSSAKNYYLNTSNISFGEHNILLNYNDESGTYSPCELSFRLIKVEYWPVDIWVEPFTNPIYSTDESVTLNVEFQDGDSHFWLDRGNVSLSFYVNDEYIPIITRSIVADEEFTPLEIDMNTITSNYGTSYPLNVEYRLNYTDLSGFYENTTKDCSFNVYKLSDYVVEIPSVTFNDGEQVYIPITIKDNEDNVITTNYNISYIKRYGTNISFELLSNNTVSISPEMLNIGEDMYWLDWMITYENGEISFVESSVYIILPKSSKINIGYLPSVYKNDKTLELKLYVYDINYWTGDPFDVGTITIKIDGEVIDTVDLSEGLYYNLQLENIEVGSHNLTLSYYDESGEHPSNETTTELYIIDSLRPVYFDSHPNLIVYKNQESVSIDVNVYQDEYDMIYNGFVTIIMDNQTIDSISLQDTYNEYYLGSNEISTGTHNITLTYNDDYGEYTDVETSFNLTKLDTYATTMNAYMSSNIIHNTDENVEINYEIKDRYTKEPVNTGNITFYLYHDENYIQIKSVEVNDGILSVDLESILSNYDSISYPLYIDAKLTYTDSSGQYQQQEQDIYFRIYQASENSVEIPDVEGSIPRYITIPVTVKDKDDNIIDPSNYYIRLKDHDTDNSFSFDREGENVIVSTEGVYAKTYTLEWSITFEDNTAITTTSMLKLNPGMNPNFNLTLYNEYYFTGYDLEVFDCQDDYYLNYIPGVITIKVDDEITETFNFSGYDYRDLELYGDEFSEGEHIILFLFENSERNISCNSSILITKVDLIKPNIQIITGDKKISILEDETSEIKFRVYDNNYEDITSGTVTLYVSDESFEYLPLTTVNTTDSLIINVSQLASIYENNEYPINIYYRLRYDGDDTTFAPTIIGSYTQLVNNKKSNIIYEKYEKGEYGTKIYLKTVDSNNTKITKGTETITIYIYDDNYEQVYEKTSTINANEDYLLISDLNLNDYFGYRFTLNIIYNDDTEEYCTSYYYSEYYNQIKNILTFNLPEHVYAQLDGEISCPFNFTDEDNNPINLKDLGFFEVSYEKDGIWYGFQNMDYDNPIIEVYGYPFNTIGDHVLKIEYALFENDLYILPENEKLLTVTILSEETPVTNINIEDVTLKSGQQVILTTTVTDQFGNSINGGKVVFKINGKSIKDQNGKVIYAKVVDGIATIEYTVPESMAGQDINITATYTGTNKYNKETTTKTITVEKTSATLTITPITEEITANTTITLKAQVTASDNPVRNGKIVFKINGKTIKDENGKVIYANLNSDGEVTIDYNIGNLKAKTYTITAIFTSKDYDKIEDSTTLTVV